MSNETNNSKSNPANNPANNNDRTLSEISHLFLSSVRDRQTNGAARPQRTPPQQQPQQQSPQPRAATPARDVMDLTNEEIRQVFDAHDVAHPAQPESRSSIRSFDDNGNNLPPATAVIASHLNGSQRQRVREYAAHLCKSGERIGLIEIDASEFRLSCFELGSGPSAAESSVCDQLDGRRMSEALEEMSWDVDRWLVNLPNPRLPEARMLLRLD